MEQYYFRQPNGKLGKSAPCLYPQCFENTQFSRSPYCSLHQKVLKNQTMDLFNSISSKADKKQWELLTYELIKRKYTCTCQELSNLLNHFITEKLTRHQMEAIWETFKVNKNVEENAELVEDRLVNVKPLFS